MMMFFFCLQKIEKKIELFCSVFIHVIINNLINYENDDRNGNWVHTYMYIIDEWIGCM